ncbi:UPF0426 protein [Apostasia shenzhenica]|uniref:UPF0426 protein n=1 Tax=Apostasia shenzhenica TaxID=1088818 RepID=A0A2I0AVP5_9ASPA|nr:UPF0426 protein [Apostasia shenzhenica]
MPLLCEFPTMIRVPIIPLSSASSDRKRAQKRGFYSRRRTGNGFRVRSFFVPFEDQPIVKDALKEPIAFMGGMFAGLLRLDLQEDPLKGWISRTVEASGLTPKDVVNGEESRFGGKEDSPQQIEIE